MTRYDNQLDSADPGLFATEPPEMGDYDSLVASLVAFDVWERETLENEEFMKRVRCMEHGAAERGQEAA